MDSPNFRAIISRFDITITLSFCFLHLLFVTANYHGPLRLISGFLFVSFLPGYALLAALLQPQLTRFSTLEHIVLSLPVSLALSTILGLLANNFGIGIDPKTHVVWMSLFIFTLSALALYRQPLCVVRFTHYAPIVGSIIAASFVFTLAVDNLTLPTEGTLLSLYILDAETTSMNYPRTVSVGAETELIVGGQFEGDAPQTYLLTSSTGTENSLILQPGEQWRLPVTINLKNTGLHRLEWNLYSSTSEQPLRTVQLWVQAE